MSELVDKDAFLKQERKWYCENCDRRKGVKNGRKCFVYEIGEVPCRACDVDDVLDNLDCFETIDAVPVVLIENCIYTWEKQARRLGSGRESTCFEMMAEAAKTILQIHAASQKIKMPTDGVKTVQFKKWKMFEETDLTSPKPITEEDLV